MPVAFYISHPQVLIDPLTPVPDWGLSEVGLTRLKEIQSSEWLRSIAKIYTSNETKAIQTANQLASERAVPIVELSDSGEIDRSSTGYVPHDEHERLADLCFENPRCSANGWERAIDAQKRIVKSVVGISEKVFLEQGNVAFVGHGGVGTFLLCHLLDKKIERKYDQPFAGHVFAFDIQTKKILFPWVALEKVTCSRS